MFSVKRSAMAASRTKASALSKGEDQPTAPLVPVTGALQNPLTTSPLSITGTSWSTLDSRVATGGLANPPDGSNLSRVPVVIKGELKRPEPLPPPSPESRRKHSKRLWILGIVVLVLTIAATLLVTTPQGQELTAKVVGPAPNSGTLVSGQHNSNESSISALATTTYMYENDGFDPYAYGQVTVSSGKSSLPWPYGQCTYWANYYYHELTGYWVPWSGNADQWFQGAQMAGWDYGQTPPVGVPSIIVLLPGVQGASSYGHVAVVTGRSGNVVHTSNMNWGYGGYGNVEEVDFTLGPGVYFVWHPAN